MKYWMILQGKNLFDILGPGKYEYELTILAADKYPEGPQNFNIFIVNQKQMQELSNLLSEKLDSLI